MKSSKRTPKKKITNSSISWRQSLPLVGIAILAAGAFFALSSAQQSQETRSRADEIAQTTTSIPPTFDTYVSMTSSIDNSKASSLRIKGGKNNLSMAMLSFALPSSTSSSKISSIKLKLHTNNESDAMSNDTYPIYVLNPDMWNSATETSKKVSLLSTKVGTVEAGSKNKWYTYKLDKKALEPFAGKAVALVIGDTKGSDGLWFDSSETSKKPSLEVNYTAN